ncbi:MAG: GldG family protein [Myxococcota bacterium]
MERKAKAATLSGAILLVIAAAAILLNVLAYGTRARVDATKNERFTLSEGSKRLVREQLTEKMTVTLYVTTGLTKIDIFVDDLTDLMDEYEEASGGNLTYTLVEPKTKEEKEKAEEAGLQKIALGQGSETTDQATITQGFMGMVFEYGSEREVIPVMSPDQVAGLEFWITNKIRNIRDKAEDQFQRIGVITKEGMKLTDTHLVPPQRGGQGGPSFKSVINQAFPFYKIEDVDLEGGDVAIDETLRGVMVLQASEDWTDKELARIDEFMMRGDKSLLVIAGAVNTKTSDATMKAELSTRNLDKLIGGYGVEMKNELIVDYGLELRMPVMTQVGAQMLKLGPAFLYVPHVDGAEPGEQLLDNGFAGFFRLQELTFPFASPLVPQPDKQPGAEIEVVARTTQYGYAMPGPSVDLKPAATLRPAGEQQARAFAVTVEGKLKSALTGQVEGVEIPAESAAPSRVLVLSSSHFLTNPFARSGNPPPMPPQMAMMGAMGGDPELTALAGAYVSGQGQYLMSTVIAFKNLLDWMTGDTDLLAASAKLLGDPKLSYTGVEKPEIKPEDTEEVFEKKQEEYRKARGDLQAKVQWSVTLVPPLLFALIGLANWRRRESTRGDVRI